VVYQFATRTEIPKKNELGPIVPPLPDGKKPNIIIILVDDFGFDDIAMHHPEVGANGQPRYLSTPNLDRLMRMSKEFRNFYVTPMCSQSRAELLTGRDYIRTGTLLVNGEFASSALQCSLAVAMQV
jgi:arylsulfatase A-like enzyme